jgi:hypothetical protein
MTVLSFVRNVPARYIQVPVSVNDCLNFCSKWLHNTFCMDLATSNTKCSSTSYGNLSLSDILAANMSNDDQHKYLPKHYIIIMTAARIWSLPMNRCWSSFPPDKNLFDPNVQVPANNIDGPANAAARSKKTSSFVLRKTGVLPRNIR